MAGNDTNVYSTFLAKRVDVDAKNKMKGFIRDSSHSIPLSVAYHVGHTEQASRTVLTTSICFQQTEIETGFFHISSMPSVLPILMVKAVLINS